MRTRRYCGRRSPFPTIGKVLITLLGITVLLGVCLFLFAVITEYRPEDYTQLTVSEAAGSQTLRTDEQYTVCSFNIGYCGQDQAQDFYTDGGQRSSAQSLETVHDNLTAVSDYLQRAAPTFILLQEVDVNSARSFGVDQKAMLENLFDEYASCFALVHKSPFVPYPLSAPTGHVESGLLTLSRTAVRESARVSFPGERPLLQQLFSPKECFLVTRIAVENGGELVLINTRISDFSDGGALRDMQLAQLTVFLSEEAEKGNYVILGGDFGGQLPWTDFRTFGHGQDMPDWFDALPDTFLPAGFQWSVDPETPSRRGGDSPYVQGGSFTAVTDGFVVSENVEVLAVATADLAFRHAAHNPVQLIFSLS